jgi:hypothetical protein
MPPKVATFCAINKSFDLPISYHGGPKVELFGVLANGCAIMLYDEMLNFCKKILCHQKLPHFVQSTNHLICPFHIMVDPRLNFLVY